MSTPNFFLRYEEICNLKRPVDHESILNAFNTILIHNHLTSRFKVEVVNHIPGNLDISGTRITDVTRSTNMVLLSMWQNSAARAAQAILRIDAAHAPIDLPSMLTQVVADSASTVQITSLGIQSEHLPGRAVLFEFNTLLQALEAGAWQLLITGNHWLILTVPSLVKLDENHRLHCGDGPALIMDDREYYHWHGVSVNSDLIYHPENITLDQINRSWNIETRRIMIERYGINRFMTDNKAELSSVELFRGRVYELYHLFQPHDEPIMTVRVMNATAESDGTFREYWLRVPPGLTSAMEAVAWTFGLTREQYVELNFES